MEQNMKIIISFQVVDSAFYNVNIIKQTLILIIQHSVQKSADQSLS